VDYDQVNHDTSALDDAMKAARDRDRMGAQANLTRARASLLGASVFPALIAGTAFVGAACAAAWIMRPHFDFHTVLIDVPKLVEKQVDVPKFVDKEVEVPKFVERTVEVPKFVEKLVETRKANEEPTPGPISEALPPKTPDKAEQKFITRPDYQSADFKGRIVRSDYNELKFEDGKQFFPALFVNGQPQYDSNGNIVRDYSIKDDVDRFIGDYAYCNWSKVYAQITDCWVIHNDLVQRILQVPYSGRTPQQSEAYRHGNWAGQ
jgi:hypothetical protein